MQQKKIEVPDKIDKIKNIADALGGINNCQVISACATRLRIEVINPELVNDKELKKLGAFGVLITGNNLQVLFGTISDIYAQELNVLKNKN
jgi:PTS system glucose-specific IIC component